MENAQLIFILIYNRKFVERQSKINVQEVAPSRWENPWWSEKGKDIT